MTALLLAVALRASTPSVGSDPETRVTAMLRNCSVERRLQFPVSDDTIVTLWRCGGPPSDPRSYVVAFVFQKAKDGWLRLPWPLIESSDAWSHSTTHVGVNNREPPHTSALKGQIAGENERSHIKRR